MPEGPQGSEIIIGRAIPPEADFVFVPTDDQGAPGVLNRHVAEETGYGAFDFDPKELENGFAIVRRDGMPTIIAVVTVRPPVPTRDLLGSNLRLAFETIQSEVVGRTVWLPLMGTGDGRLSPLESLEATLVAIRAKSLAAQAQPAQLALAVDPDVDDDTMTALARTAHDAFGDALRILDPMAGTAEKADDGGDDYVPNFRQESVRRVQQFLRDQGYTDVPVDGLYDPRTRDAIDSYKAAHGLDQSPMPVAKFLELVEPATKVEGTATESPSIEVELTRDLVRRIQQTLTGQGHGNVVADGVIGPQTRTAIRRFQAARGEDPTGIVTMPLIDALGISGEAADHEPQADADRNNTPDTGRTTGEPKSSGSTSSGSTSSGSTSSGSTSSGSTSSGSTSSGSTSSGSTSSGSTSSGSTSSEPEPAPTAPPDATAPFYPDHPAVEDQLGRRAIAEAIATIARDAWRVSDERRGGDVDRTFMVHIHGRWGSGKSSILNFLREILRPAESERDAAGDAAAATAEPAAPSSLARAWRHTKLLLGDLPHLFGEPQAAPADDSDWVVVDYNAWRNQGHGSPWWSLLNRVHAEAYEQLGGFNDARARRLRWQDVLWRLRLGWTPYALAAAALIVAILLFTLFMGIELTKGLTAVGSVLAVTAGIFTFGKTYQIGSAQTASTFLEATRDPLRPLIHRYDAMIAEIGRPVAVFIDDLDRCDAKFVVELLQSIQTLYRHARVLYVVAADRDWICCSYEQVYEDFGDAIGEAGRPLGHLFLEKIFQLSITVPNISRTMRRDYWSRLVSGRLGAPEADAAAIEAEEKATIETLDTEAEIRAHTESIHDPVRRRIAGAQAFSRLQSQRLRTEREHFLTRFAPFIEPNPRAMKRLVNAYGFKRGFELMAGSASPAVPLVHWTILELRWPALAAHLARHPQDIAMAGDKIEASQNPTIRLLADPQVIEVARELSPDLIRTLTGDGTIETGAEPAAA